MQASSGKVSSNNVGNGQTHRSNSKNYFHGKETSEEALTKIYLENNIVNNQGTLNAKKVPKAYLQKVLADNRSKTSLKQHSGPAEVGGISNTGIINSSFNQLKR
jgi:hypothetical protein